MSLRADSLIARARNRHPAFDGNLVPLSIALDFLSETQSRIVRKLHKIDPDFLARTWVIALAADLTARVGPGVATDTPSSTLNPIQPAATTAPGVMVVVGANGQPTLDSSQAVTVPISQGIPIPPGQYINHGQIYWVNGEKYPDRSRNLTLVPMVARYSAPNSYSAAVQGRFLYLCPPFEQWMRVERIELPYLPNPPKFAAEADLAFLPDDAEDALVGGLVQLMAGRIAQLGAVSQPLDDIVERAGEAVTDFIDLATGAGRAVVDQIEDVGY